MGGAAPTAYSRELASRPKAPVIQLNQSGSCEILPTQQVPMLLQLCDWMAVRHGGDGKVLAVAWYNKMFGGAKTKPTVEELVQVFYRAYVNDLDPMLDGCHAYITVSKDGSRKVVFTVGIDGWLGRAAEHKDFKGCHAEAICENDAFEWDAVLEQPSMHRYGKKNRGEVLGGWGRLKRQDKPDLVMTLDRSEFMALLQGGGRDFLHKKLSKHLTRWLVIRHLVRQAYPKTALRGTMLPEEAGAVTTKLGTVLPEAEKAKGPNPDELPKSETERTDLLEEIDELFTALKVTSENEKERNIMRRKKAELVLKRELKHVGLGDLFDTDLVTLRDGLRREKDGKDEPLTPEVVTPEVEPPATQAAPDPNQGGLPGTNTKEVDDRVECAGCKEKKIPKFLADAMAKKGLALECTDCKGPNEQQ